MNSTKRIAKEIFPLCFDVETNIVKGNQQNSLYWAKSNSFRNSITISNILSHIKSNSLNNLSILNFSGIAAGQVDFPIMEYLRTKATQDIYWASTESPQSSYLENEYFKSKMEELKIDLKIIDFRFLSSLNGIFNSKFDIILFTEIAEHLDYSTLLNTLKSLSILLNDNGICIITTPNLLSLGYRIKMLMGSTRNMFWGDGLANLHNGLFGHITYYEIDRLKRILGEVNLEVIKSFTFDYGIRTNLVAIFIGLIKKKILKLFSTNLNASIFIVARKTNLKENIPFKI